MSSQHKHKYPPREELVELNKAHGFTKVAHQLGIKPTTYHSYCRNHDIPTVKEARELATESVGDLDVAEEEMLRQRVKELEAMLRKDRKETVYDERITAAVEKNLQKSKPGYKPKVRIKSKRKHKHEFVLLLSDLHAGETVSYEETGGINAYDWDIMLRRLDKVRQSVTSYQEHRPYPIETLRIFALGDQLSGNIHAELEATNEIPLAEATVQLGADLSEFVESMTELFPKVTFDGVVGNHPRAHKKPWAKQGYDNADWTAYKIAETTLRNNENITFNIPKASQHRVTVAENWHALLLHGDGIRSSMPGIPWGGVARRVNALAAQYNAANQPIDCCFLGHFHTANWVQTNAGWIGMNGSVKGPDEYSMKQFGGGSPAQQALITFHPEHGPTDFSVIDLKDIK